MSTAFLSYSRSDSAIVDEIANDLQKEGIDIWLDRKDLLGGQNWREQIENALNEASFLILFISKNSLESKAVQYELRSAFERQKRSGGTRLIPVLLERVELPDYLSGIQYIDFTQSTYQGMQSLIKAVRTSSGAKPKDVVPVKDLAKEVADEVARILGIENKSFPIKPTTTIDPKLVFVIIAFREDMEPIFEGIKAAGTSLGLDVKRVKDIVGDYRITDQIIQMITSARFVVADLTHERPNVYFELGFARGLGKTVISIARDGTNVHFDVKDWTYIPYIDSRILENDIKKRFEYELSRDGAL